MKNLEPIVFDLAQCRVEIDRFRTLLESKAELSERNELLPFFRDSPQLVSFLGTNFTDIGPANRIAREFQIFGHFSADLIIGNVERQTYCAIELEDARPNSLFHALDGKSTTEWGRRFEHGFSQLVDWFFAFDDHKSTADFARCFGYGHIEFFGMLVIGRSSHVSDFDRSRLRWRSGRVTINSHKIICRTYDELCESLERDWRLQALGSSIGQTPVRTT